jgi:hypothetical protein
MLNVSTILGVVMLKLVVLLSIAVLNVIIPSVGMLSVIMLNVVAPKLSPMTAPKADWVLYYKTFTVFINTPFRVLVTANGATTLSITLIKM